ncbi:arylmalonate decarboxylase [Kitasatospora sp. NPDC093806]|uniref:maleate cis-trans isomerase family protein n=1 Tax=Kitasatospora sp. NPDC093806 TaxID=3155075 RepID=UPI0034320591
MDILPLPRFGLVVPPENPVAEPEFNRFIGSELNVYTTRFPVTPVFDHATMELYNEVLPDVLATFGKLALGAAVVACNASHYLFGPDGDAEFLAGLSQRFGYPVQSTSHAIVDLLEVLGQKRLTLVSPYAPWLTDISRGYWEKAGLTVDHIAYAPAEAGVDGAEDRFNPYEVTTATLLERVRAAGVPGDGVLLFTGTGMATVTAAEHLAREGDARTLVTSNLASAWWARRTLGLTGAAHPLVERLNAR